MRPRGLIIHPGATGDVLLSLPAIRSLRASFPDCEFGLLAGSEVGRLLLECSEIERLFPIESGALAGLLAGAEAVSEALRTWLTQCHLAVCWMADPESRLAQTLLDIRVRSMVVRSPSSPGLVAVRQSDRFLETVQRLVPSAAAEKPLRPPRHVLENGREQLSAVSGRGDRVCVVVHPGSGSPHKCTAPALLARAVDWLEEIGLAPILVQGPADEQRVAEVVRFCVRSPATVRGLGLLEVAGFLAHARLYIGHDSGLTHLAALLGLPTIALFGPTDAGRWAPRGPLTQVLTGGPCSCRGWEAVRRCGGKPCLQVAVGSLIQACQNVLATQETRSEGPDRAIPSLVRPGGV
ncbi:MAG: glycosyltransferase family 9 protein [Nitrospirota bacterium]